MICVCVKKVRIFMKAKLYINKDNLMYNINYIKNKIGNRRKIIAMVKANAYGIGAKAISCELQKIGITDFGVANIEEAIALRNNGISGMILVTSVVIGEEIKAAIENDISMSVSDLDNIEKIDEIAKKIGKVANIHLKIETGMLRLGFNINYVTSIINKIIQLKNINIQGIYTHLSCADSDEEYTNNQIEEFKKIVSKLSKVKEFEYIHILNSDGVSKYTDKVDIDTHVRVGIMMYGYGENTRPILKLTAPIIHVNNVDKYEKVGYGGTFIAKPNMKIAVVKIGYADGINRSLSNKISVKVNGIECQQVGNICMDLMMVDISKVNNVKINDEVVIWDYTDDLKNIAKITNKIVYEVISGLGNRIERIME